MPLPAPRLSAETFQVWPEELNRLRVAPPATVKLGVFLKIRGPCRFRVPALTVVTPACSKDAP